MKCDLPATILITTVNKKILLILRNLNKKQGINTKIHCSSWENKASYSSHDVSLAEPGNCVIDKAQCIEFDF